MSTWTEEQKQDVIDKYLAAEPTPESSTEIIKEIAEELDQSPNGIRMILVQAKVYVKKDAGASTAKGGTTKGKTEGSGEKRVSKESQIAALKEAIEAKGGEVDDDILSKLTGKAAAYFTTILKK
jgi:hypothetical protein